MKKVEEYKIANELPDNLRSNPINFLAATFDSALVLDNSFLSIYNSIDSANESLINLLGRQHHIERWRDDNSHSNKRELVKSSFLMHKRKGTSWAVKQAVSLFFQEATIQEWFEYDGEPYFFRPFINMTDARVVLDNSQKAELIAVINSVKNIRSWLDGIVLKLELTDIVDSDDIIYSIINYEFEEYFPYGGFSSNRYGHVTVPFIFHPFQDLDIDELHFDSSVQIDERYEKRVEYGHLKYGFKVGGLMTLPRDKRLQADLSLKTYDENYDDVADEGRLIVEHHKKYGRRLIVGKFTYGISREEIVL